MKQYRKNKMLGAMSYTRLWREGMLTLVHFMFPTDAGVASGPKLPRPRAQVWNAPASTLHLLKPRP
jgi:hypothetical protein